MNHPQPLGEGRPDPTPADDPFVPEPHTPVPLLRLRSRERGAIRPEDCKVPHCPICGWRLAGLIPPVG